MCVRTDHPSVFPYEVGGERGGGDQTAPERAEATEQLLLSARSLGSKLPSKEAPPGRGSEHRGESVGNNTAGSGRGAGSEFPGVDLTRAGLESRIRSVSRRQGTYTWGQGEAVVQAGVQCIVDTVPQSPQTPSGQDGLEEESRKAESLPDASGLLHPHPRTEGTPQEEQVASATANFHVHVRELWIPSEGPLSRASPEGLRRSRAEKQRDRPDGPKAPSQSVEPGSLQHRLPSGSSVVSSLSLTITEFCPALHA